MQIFSYSWQEKSAVLHVACAHTDIGVASGACALHGAFLHSELKPDRRILRPLFLLLLQA